MNLSDYINDADWQHFLEFAADKPTPCVIVNLSTIRRKYEELQDLLPYAKIFYAVKANPADPVVALLRDLGANFDIASVYELDKLLRLGISPDRISFGNTIKKEKDVRYAYEKGVRLFVTDSHADLINIANQAPGSRVFIRILVEGSYSADWPLSRKFGCHPDMAFDLVIKSVKLGLEPYGVSFHVGSQQRDIGIWDDAISKAKYLFSELLRVKNIKLRMINMGGGLPGNYLFKTQETKEYAAEITRYLAEDFEKDMPDIYIEPGRSLVADSGITVSEVVLISKKTPNALHRWIYTDVGKFSGLIETIDESIKYPIHSDKSGKVGPVILAGPTCDSMDIMYENYKYELPLDITIGDKIYWFTTGAYTASYSSVEFNGFPPIKVYFME
jgi:ornithine decarboxylase